MRLSRNFTLDELTATQTGLPNVPNAQQIANLWALCDNILQPLRDHLGRALVVTSGFRTPAVNRAVGGSATSDHCNGRAADVRTAGLNSYKLAKLVINLGLPFDQVIQYPGSARIHVSYRPQPRREVKRKVPGGYAPGLKA